jgi:sec-independent protein translocase protein TatA
MTNPIIHLAIINPQTALFIMLIMLLLFGAKKLPELARGLGQAIKEFSKAKNDIHDEIMRDPAPEAPRQIPTQTVQQAPGTQPVGAQPVNAEQQPGSHV